MGDVNSVSQNQQKAFNLNSTSKKSKVSTKARFSVNRDLDRRKSPEYNVKNFPVFSPFSFFRFLPLSLDVKLALVLRLFDTFPSHLGSI